MSVQLEALGMDGGAAASNGFAKICDLSKRSSSSRQPDPIDLEMHGQMPASIDRSLVSQIFSLLQTSLLLIGNICAWYTTNGMNGIAMQSFAGMFRKDGEGHLMSIFAITAVVTAIQLAGGAIVGLLMLTVYYKIMQVSANPHSVSARMSHDQAILGTLHAMGSIFTNLGFMYGSASLIQIIKLLEPFETLFLSQLLLPQEGKLHVGVFSSMLVVVGAAISLIKMRKKSPHPHAVVFAILSGMTLSSRNVLQRRQHLHKAENLREHRQESKLEKSILQFTKLSFHSAIMTSAMAFVSNAGLLLSNSSFESHRAMILIMLDKAINWKVVTWHPLYNAFSMITLGFVSALTHSLLNAGKRVFAIVMAIVWFREDFGKATAVGLAAVAMGGCWYTVETKSKEPMKSTLRWGKLLLAVLLLQSIFSFEAPSG